MWLMMHVYSLQSRRNFGQQGMSIIVVGNGNTRSRCGSSMKKGKGQRSGTGTKPTTVVCRAKMEEHGNMPVHLSLRGERLTLTREGLMNLPESILLCLFPNGIVLNNPPPLRPSSSSQESLEEEEEEVYFVDVCSSRDKLPADRRLT